jgi:hypothetical protein
MESNKEESFPFVDGDIKNQLQEQLRTDGTLGSWATEAQLFAISTILCRNIIVNDDGIRNVFSPLTTLRHLNGMKMNRFLLTMPATILILNWN